uniref:mRNA-decapping enzyme 2 n=1 Tax=Romanomermis culicivorax TaxID=13658 RepID=A0A915L9S5_ROMCU
MSSSRLLEPLVSSHILDDVCSRFIINMPKDQLEDPNRICFQLELAYWFYWDNYEEELNKCSLKEFIRIVFNYLPYLKRYSNNVGDIVEKWRSYKALVPTYGAILMDEALESVILVQGDFARASWGFPKGKVNEGEPPHMCAIREVREETGFDISKLLDQNLYFERKINETTVRLYIIQGVDRHFPFKPETKNEIREVRWFRLTDLPDKKNFSNNSGVATPLQHQQYYQQQNKILGVPWRRFFGVIPFIEPIKKFIRQLNGENVSPVPNDENFTCFGYYVQNGCHSTPNMRQSNNGYHRNNNSMTSVFCKNFHVENVAKNDRRRTKSLNTPMLKGASMLDKSTTPTSSNMLYNGKAVSITPQALLDSVANALPSRRVYFTAGCQSPDHSKLAKQQNTTPSLLEAILGLKIDCEKRDHHSTKINEHKRDFPGNKNDESSAKLRESRQISPRKECTTVYTPSRKLSNSRSFFKSSGDFFNNDHLRNSDYSPKSRPNSEQSNFINISVDTKRQQPRSSKITGKQRLLNFDNCNISLANSCCRKEENEIDKIRLADKWSNIRFDWSAVFDQL